MPFQADTRVNFMLIKLNVNNICEELESYLEKEYSEDINEGSKFWLYVIYIENEYEAFVDNAVGNTNFWDWFLTDGEYNNVPMWDEIKDNFKDVE